MASVSFGLNRGADSQPDQVTVGTLAVSTNDVELRIDNTTGLTRQEITEITHRLLNEVNDGRQAVLANV